MERSCGRESPTRSLRRSTPARRNPCPAWSAFSPPKTFPGVNRYGIAFQDQEALAADRVRYIGDPVALVAAETEEIAREAVKAIRVKYRPLPVITNPREGLAEGAVKIHEKGNLLLHTKLRKGDIAPGVCRGGRDRREHL